MNTERGRVDIAADEAIASRIMNAMIVKGISMKALAADAGMSYTTIRRSLHQSRPDSRSLDVNEFLGIAKALTIHPSALLPEEVVELGATG